MMVVAVDDGWMPQTEDHFRVLELLGIERMIIVLTKIDLADKDQAAIAAENIKKKIAATFYSDSDIIAVSSRTGEGLPNLKNAVLSNIKKLAKAHNANKPFMFIDRTFAAKGHGTVITGSLKNGSFCENDSLMILPIEKTVRVKRIENHNASESEGGPSQRIALNVSGVDSDEISRGHIAVIRNFFTKTNELVAVIKKLDERRAIKNNSSIDVLTGTSSMTAKFIFIENTDMGAVARLRFEKPYHVYLKERFIITAPGGTRVIGGGEIIFASNESVSSHDIKTALPVLATENLEDHILFVLTLKKWMHFENLRSSYKIEDSLIDKSISSLISADKAAAVGEFIFAGNHYEQAVKSIEKTIKEARGLNIKEISDTAYIDIEICQILIPLLQKKKPITERDGKYFYGGSISEDDLTPEQRDILARALAQAGNGLSIDIERDEKKKMAAKELIKMGFLVSLDAGIIYHHAVYSDIRRSIIELFNTRERITVQEAKEAVGLSRKYVLPLLNKIEGEGLIKRFGDYRVKR
jgi:selenocysteine-specific elongation factor